MRGKCLPPDLNSPEPTIKPLHLPDSVTISLGVLDSHVNNDRGFSFKRNCAALVGK